MNAAHRARGGVVQVPRGRGRRRPSLVLSLSIQICVAALFLCRSWPSLANPVVVAVAGQANPREMKARELFGVGHYADALEIFAKLYAETGHPTYLRNIGRCYQNLREPDKAISSFQEYLRQAKNLSPEQRAQIEGFIGEMEALKQKQQAKSAPPPPPPPPSPPPDPGPRPPAVAAPGGKTVAAPPGKTAEPAGGGARADRSIAYWIGGAGLASMAAGAYFGVRALSKREASDGQCPMGRCSVEGVALNDQAKTAARIANITIAAGLVAAGVATYLFIARSKEEPVTTERAARSARLVPQVGRHEAGLILEATF